MYGGIHRAIAEAGTYTYAIMSPATGEELEDGVFAFGDAAASQPGTAAAVGLATTMAALIRTPDLPHQRNLPRLLKRRNSTLQR